jgi:serine phosphatase RsbU (regulator of sigma subunit)
LVIVAVVVANTLDDRIMVYRLLGAAPALAAATFSAVGTLGIGILAVGVGVALVDADHALFETPGMVTFGALAVITLAGVHASRERQKQERTLAQVRLVADTAQRALLGPMSQHWAEVTIDGLYRASAAQARIGGDFYEAYRTPHGVRMLFGDVRGKGLPAVDAASAILGSFRSHARQTPDLPALAQELESHMNHYYEDSVGQDAGEHFITALLVEIPASEYVVRLLNCGHPAPLLLHDGEMHELEPSAPSPPINMAGLIGGDYHVDVVPFTVGDRLLLYTDGITESRDRTGTFYPFTQRIRQWASQPPRQLLESLDHDLATYSDSHDDDLSALVVHRLGAGEHEQETPSPSPTLPQQSPHTWMTPNRSPGGQRRAVVTEAL